jgi:DNA-binding MarR family transcriptional regulator
MARDNVYKPLAHLLNHIGKLLREKLSSDLTESGLYFGQARILEALLHNDNLNQGKIGRALQIKPATVTNQVKRMEAAGLIDRSKDVNDDRFMNVTLTPKGREAAKLILNVMIQIEQEICSVLTKKEIDMLRKPLEKVRDKLGGVAPEI